ncbi:MAG: hypothetical protein AAFZ17_10010 [Cyanobacteria bacterium J06650_10]
MKLPTTPIPVTLQDMKLPGIRPLKRWSRKLRRGELFQSSRASSSESKLNETSSSEASTSGKSATDRTQALINNTQSKRTKLFLNLLLVRPWVLVLGFWLFSMMTGGLALSGMLSPRKLTQALPAPAITESSQASSSASINVEKAAEEIAIEGGLADESAASSGDNAVTVADNSAGFPVLPLVVLVGSCAAGSLVISRRRAMMRLSAARAKGRVRKVRQPVRQPLKKAVGKGPALKSQNQSKSQSNVASATGANQVPSQGPSQGASRGKAMPKKRRQRVRRNAVTAQKKGGQNARVLASRTNAQVMPTQASSLQAAGHKASAKKPSAKKLSLSARAQANRVQAKRATRGAKRQVARTSMRAASRRQPVVSVVPASEGHALDWTRGSLAHQMDVRPQRRAM